jgi:hypothetical protein
MILNLIMIMKVHIRMLGVQDPSDPATQAIDPEIILSALRNPQHPKIKGRTQDFVFEFTTRNATVKQDTGKSFVILTGLIGDMTEIRNETLQQLVQLNCEHHVAIHILAMTVTNHETIQEQRETYDKCAPFKILKQNDEVKTLFPNRIDRIAYLRDVQRDTLRRQFIDNSTEKIDMKRSAVIVMDLDLYQIPSNAEIVREVRLLMEDQDGADVICAAGIMFRPFGYYDVFATVLNPSSFAYPLNGRLVNEYRKEDDKTRVRSNNVYGAFTQLDLLADFEEKASMSTKEYVPVRSCFGGMAVYRASTWFLTSCKYNSDSSGLMEFANAADGRPCEHVVFHECLSEHDLSTIIAVKPSLQPLREEPIPDRSQLFSGEKPVDDRIVTFYKYPDKRTTLRNGEYTLGIDQAGILAVTRKDPKSSSTTVVWTARPDLRLFHDTWSVMFMMVQSDGQLVLKQQVRDEDLHSDIAERNCDYFDKNDESVCRLIIWRSGKKAPSKGSFTLSLTETGDLEQVDALSNQIVWSSRDGHQPSRKGNSSHLQHLETANVSTRKSPSDCIPSGDETSINSALDRPGATVMLCPGAVIHLTNPIVFSNDNQTLCTKEEGEDSTMTRATIIVDDSSVATAVSMSGVSYATLKNVIVDGNRRKFGAITLQRYAGGLIDAGGDTAHGQHIIGVDAFDPRTWTCLRVMPGSPGARCKGIVVENNHFGQAGSVDHPADGISYACKEGTIRENTIEDVTDTGIELTGAPRTIVRDNVVRSLKRRMRVGISMSSVEPFGGDYTDTIVRANLVDAGGAMIDVGLAMGSKIFGCRLSDEEETRVVFGGTVINNTLTGDFMGYGYAVSGVRDWNVVENQDFSMHPNVPFMDCNGQRPSAPKGFQIDRSNSEGDFQSEFISGALVGIATANTGTETFGFKSNKLQFTNQSFAPPSQSLLLEEQMLL